MTEPYSRHLNFERITNFRDIGGYPARDGRTIAWRCIFRSGELANMNDNDFSRLTEEITLRSVIDLRSEVETSGHDTGYLDRLNVKYHSVPFMTSDGNCEEDERMFYTLTHMGEFYLYLVRWKEFGSRIVKALELIADTANHPLVFHCAIGKDRTGILTAVLLSVLGVNDDVIIQDYSLSESYMEEVIARADDNPEIAEAVRDLPDFFWKADPESMTLFLSTLRKEYGSVADYLYAQGADNSLVQRLEDALLT